MVRDRVNYRRDIIKLTHGGRALESMSRILADARNLAHPQPTLKSLSSFFMEMVIALRKDMENAPDGVRASLVASLSALGWNALTNSVDPQHGPGRLPRSAEILEFLVTHRSTFQYLEQGLCQLC